MKVALIALLSGLALSAVASTQVTAPGQVNRPGEISPPNVWVQNRNPDEAIPVKFVDVNQPVRVLVTGTIGRADNVLPTIAARQAWDYTQVRIGANQDPAAALASFGSDGWEATGLQFPTNGGTIVVLKRPR